MKLLELIKGAFMQINVNFVENQVSFSIKGKGIEIAKESEICAQASKETRIKTIAIIENSSHDYNHSLDMLRFFINQWGTHDIPFHTEVSVDFINAHQNLQQSNKSYDAVFICNLPNKTTLFGGGSTPLNNFISNETKLVASLKHDDNKANLETLTSFTTNTNFLFTKTSQTQTLIRNSFKTLLDQQIPSTVRQSLYYNSSPTSPRLGCMW